MKTHSLILSAAALAVLSTFASATEKELTAKQVPQAVHEAFQKAHPAVKEAKYSEETADGKTLYEVAFKDGGKKFEASYSADGTLIETEEEIKTAELPAPVLDAVKKAHPHAAVHEAEKVTKADGTTGYEVEIADGKKKLEIELDAAGTIVKTEAKND